MSQLRNSISVLIKTVKSLRLAYKMKGNCFLELNDFSNAVDSYNKGHKDKWTYQNLGKAYYGLAKYELALENFKKVIEMDPKYKWAYHGAGDCLFQMEEYDEALTTYESLIERDEYYYFNSDTYHILINMSLLYLLKLNLKSKCVYKLDNGYATRKDGLWWHYCKNCLSSKEGRPLYFSKKHKTS